MQRAPAARTRQRGFFDFSFPEMVITFGVALVVLGPKKLPGVVAQLGRWVGRARHMARQFREQLEQEVNSINAVKPIPRPTPAEVGPNPPEIQAANAAATASATSGTEAAGAVDSGAMTPGTAADPTSTGDTAGAGAEGKLEAAGDEVHPESQIYFALNGTQPEVVAENPYAAQNDPYAPQPDGTEPSTAIEPPAANPTPAEGATSGAAGEPASVKVIFPHDHG
ncbi:MAG TPA: twin-arginine translocase TatA/TatE family subunit [Steroidobacteraceae bacterium]|jgi:sec-independent protein translocase protein TatB